MPKTLLIILIGPVSVGKTTLGQKISKELTIPMISKDSIKELFFDTTGWHNDQYAHKVGDIAYPLLYYFADLFLQIPSSLILDGNFTPKYANSKIAELKKKYDFLPIQINCFADGQILTNRFHQRTNSNFRHPGHCEDCIFEDIKESLCRGCMEILEIDGEVLNLDMTDFEQIDYQKLFQQLRRFSQ